MVSANTGMKFVQEFEHVTRHLSMISRLVCKTSLVLAVLQLEEQLRDLRQQLHKLRNLPEAVALIMNAISDILLPAVHGSKVCAACHSHADAAGLVSDWAQNKMLTPA